MPLTFSEILQAGVGAISLFILYQVILSTSRESERRDAAATAERARQDREDERRDKSEERLMMLVASITGKQDASTAQLMKSGVDSEGRVSSQLTTAESNIKGRVAAGADANILAFEKVYRLLESAAKIALSRPPDPLAAQKYDRALEILTAQVEAVEADVAGVKADTAANTDARVNTAEIAAAVVPAAVVIADVSKEAVDTIVSAMMPAPDAGAATAGDESEAAA